MKGLSTEQNVHKSTNIVHDLATLIVLTQPPDSLTLLIDPAHQKKHSREGLDTFYSRLQPI